MSSTNRGSERDGDDHYQSPKWCVRAIVPHMGPLVGKSILESSCGRGAIIEALVQAGAAASLIEAYEIDPHRADVARKLGVNVTCADFTQQPVLVTREHPAFDMSVINPPFNAAQDHIQQTLSWLAPDGVLWALLRLAWICGGKRAAFRKRYPFDIYPMSSRPSFTAEALAWMTDDDLRGIAKPVKGGGRIETIDEVRKRLKGSDSCEYAWMRWDAVRVLGKVYTSDRVLDGRT